MATAQNYRSKECSVYRTNHRHNRAVGLVLGQVERGHARRIYRISWSLAVAAGLLVLNGLIVTGLA